jgi:hypothetical protein
MKPPRVPERFSSRNSRESGSLAALQLCHELNVLVAAPERSTMIASSGAQLVREGESQAEWHVPFRVQ